MFIRIAKFWFGIFAAITVFSAVATYGFGVYEPQWGPAISVQVAMLLGVVNGLVGAIGFGIGLRVSGRTPGTWWCVLSGAVVAMLMVGGYELLRRVNGPSMLNDLPIFAFSILLSAFAAFAYRGAVPRV